VLDCFREAAATIGMRVVQVSCGENHTLALVETSPGERRLFVWGNNDKLQLGLDNGII
jgi:alpha-tubulin suppressor-like RCC1 family protein